MPITQILFTQGSGSGGSPSIDFYGWVSSMNEGSTNTVNVEYQNYPLTTIYWQIVNDGTENADWLDSEIPIGSIEISGTGSTTFSWTTAEDLTTEGNENYLLQVGTTLGGNDLLNETLTIVDTSVAPPTNFTIEWWQKVESGGGSSPRPWSVGLYPTQQLALSYESKVSDYFWINNSYVNATSQDHRGQGWRHMAYVRNNGVLKGYINGTQYTPNITSNQLITGTTIPLYVGTGQASAGTFNGYITNLHIMKGVAKYVEDFTAPTGPIVPTAGSVFLLLARDNENSGVDATGAHGILATVGTTTWNSDTPFTAPTPAGPYTQFTGTFGNGGEGVGNLDFSGENYNTNLLNVKRGWTVTDGTTTGYVVNDAFIVAEGVIRIDVNFNVTALGTWTFTQYEIGGSLYFNGSSYLNYGASADWAPDA